MSIEEWQPVREMAINGPKLRELVSVVEAADEADLAGSLPQSVLDQTSLMKQEVNVFAQAEELTDAELVSLVRFFTLAEAQLTGWEGGRQNPAIYLVRILRNRDSFSDELRRWIKGHTSNRYLPYGSAL